MNDGFIPAHGGYQGLVSYQKAEITYDTTVKFCAAFLHKYDRTIDQMVQAARSGKQNIVEASMASGTSKETEIKLTNMVRASLDELLTDYRDLLRTRDLAGWPKNSREAFSVRRLSAGKITPPAGHGNKATNEANDSRRNHQPSAESHTHHPCATFDTFRPFFEIRPPEVQANIVICLIYQTNYLLDQQLKRLERDFLQEGGLRERMTRARLVERHRQRRSKP